jgi:hypothetical protein
MTNIHNSTVSMNTFKIHLAEKHFELLYDSLR